MPNRLLASSLLLGLATVAACAAPQAESEDLGSTESREASASDRVAFDYFLGKGLTPVQAAGIVGNLDQESGMSPTIAQIGGGPGRGIAQWSVGGRWDTTAGGANVLAFARKNGKDAKSLGLQLDFIWFELTTFPNYGLAQLKAAKTVNAAVLAFQDKYEICGNCAPGNRLRFANAALDAFGGDKGTPSAGDEPDILLSGEGSQLFEINGQQHAFYRVGDELRHAFWDPADRQIHHDVWGTGIAGEPATFTVNGQQHAFARGTNGAVEHWFWDPTSKQITHDTWGQGIASDPTVALINGQQHVWATDAAGNLRHWFYDPTGKNITADTWGSGVTGKPTYFQNGADQHVFARGTNGALEHFFWMPASGIKHDVWGQGLAGDPAAAIIGDGQHVWAVDGAGALQHWFWLPASGVNHDTWVAGGLTGRPSVLAIGDQQHAFVRSASGAVEHYFWSPDGGITHDTWGTGITTNPATIVQGGGQHVYAQDAAGTLQHWFWTESTGIVHDTW